MLRASIWGPAPTAPELCPIPAPIAHQATLALGARRGAEVQPPRYLPPAFPATPFTGVSCRDPRWLWASDRSRFQGLSGTLAAPEA